MSHWWSRKVSPSELLVVVGYYFIERLSNRQVHDMDDSEISDIKVIKPEYIMSIEVSRKKRYLQMRAEREGLIYTSEILSTKELY